MSRYKLESEGGLKPFVVRAFLRLAKKSTTSSIDTFSFKELKYRVTHSYSYGGGVASKLF